MKAMVRIRVRIDTQQYLDYLSWHLIGGAWRITAKSFHVERVYETAA
jgi:Putative lumazine-binding